MIELPNGYPTLEWSAKQLVMDNPALYYTLPVKMFGHFWYVWCKMALAEVGVSLL
jgi:hypothetical protein